MSWQASDIKWLDCEISSLCNAGCVDCNRWIYNWEKDQMQLNSYNQHMDKFVDLEVFVKRIKKFLNLKFILLQGNVGDPMTHPNISQIVDKIFQLFPHIRLEINTNGSVGSLSSWQKLCDYTKQDMSIVFSIDGLEDTNHIYRRGCDWSKIMRNTKLWIDAGGQAEWKMLDFPYNEHQRDEARQLANQMGFNQFFIRERYTRTNEMDHFIIEKSKEPVKKIWFDQTLHNTEEEINHYEIEKQEYIDWTVKPACKDVSSDDWNHWPNFHMNVEGTLWPCCFTSNLPYIQGHQRIIWQKMNQQYEAKHGLNWNNLDHRSLQEILDTDWFSQDLPNSWNSLSGESIMLCHKNCGNCDKSYVWNNPANPAGHKKGQQLDA